MDELSQETPNYYLIGIYTLCTPFLVSYLHPMLMQKRLDILKVAKKN